MSEAEVKPAPSAFDQAIALHKQKRFAEAEAVLAQALKTAPLDPDLHNARGVMFAAMDRPADAARCYRAAISVRPDRPQYWSNLGNALTKLKQLQTALDAHRRALASNPDDARTNYNYGVTLGEAERYPEAIAAYDRAIELDPKYLDARWDRGRAHLFLGDFEKGFSDYEVRIEQGKAGRKDAPGERWKGQPFKGKRLIILSEQGFGDSIWCMRYLPHVKALGGELIVECRPELMPLVETMGHADRVVNRDEPPPEADFHLYVCSLPGLFAKSPELLAPAPYIFAPEEQKARLKPYFDRAGPRLKVGIIWSGSVTFGRNSERALGLRQFLDAFVMPGVQLYSIQKGPPHAQLEQVKGRVPIIDLDPELNDFRDTAAAIDQLDLVLMTDSGAAHLAGAMGKPVWVLLNTPAYWLWLLDRDDSPWYPSMRFFRPRAPGDWDHVIDSAAQALMALANERLPRPRPRPPAHEDAAGS